MARAYFKDSIKDSGLIRTLTMPVESKSASGWYLWTNERLGSEDGRLFLETSAPVPSNLVQYVDYYSARVQVIEWIQQGERIEHGYYSLGNCSANVTPRNKSEVDIIARGPTLPEVLHILSQVQYYHIKPVGYVSKIVPTPCAVTITGVSIGSLPGRHDTPCININLASRENQITLAVKQEDLVQILSYFHLLRAWWKATRTREKWLHRYRKLRTWYWKRREPLHRFWAGLD